MAVATLVALASVALALDFVDGQVARRTGTASALGAQTGRRGRCLPDPRAQRGGRPLGRRVGARDRRERATRSSRPGGRSPGCARRCRGATGARSSRQSQGIALTIAAAEVVPLARDPRRPRRRARPARRVVRPRRLVAVAAPRAPRPRPRGRASALAEPSRSHCSPSPSCGSRWSLRPEPWLLTPGAFVRLPLEGIVVVVLAVVLPDRARRVIPWVIGPALGLLVLVKLLDLGFFIAFDRPFNPVDDWSFVSHRRRDGARHVRPHRSPTWRSPAPCCSSSQRSSSPRWRCSA